MASDSELDKLAWTMLGEAAGEGRDGMIAVANVAINRANDPQGRWPSTIGGVISQPLQFSTWNSGEGGNNPTGRFPKSSQAFRDARALAEQVVNGQLPDLTGGATHYHTNTINPSWAGAVNKHGTLRVGNHTFYPERPTPAGYVPTVASATSTRQAPTPATQSPGLLSSRTVGGVSRSGGVSHVADGSAAAYAPSRSAQPVSGSRPLQGYGVSGNMSGIGIMPTMNGMGKLVDGSYANGTGVRGGYGPLPPASAPRAASAPVSRQSNMMPGADLGLTGNINPTTSRMQGGQVLNPWFSDLQTDRLPYDGPSGGSNRGRPVAAKTGGNPTAPKLPMSFAGQDGAGPQTITKGPSSGRVLLPALAPALPPPYMRPAPTPAQQSLPLASARAAAGAVDPRLAAALGNSNGDIAPNRLARSNPLTANSAPAIFGGVNTAMAGLPGAAPVPLMRPTAFGGASNAPFPAMPSAALQKFRGAGSPIPMQQSPGMLASRKPPFPAAMPNAIKNLRTPLTGNYLNGPYPTGEGDMSGMPLRLAPIPRNVPGQIALLRDPGMAGLIPPAMMQSVAAPPPVIRRQYPKLPSGQSPHQAIQDKITGRSSSGSGGGPKSLIDSSGGGGRGSGVRVFAIKTGAALPPGTRQWTSNGQSSSRPAQAGRSFSR